MKGLIYKAENVLSWEDVPDVSPKKGEVKIKVKATGICGSDIHGFKGISGRRIPPMIMGHEFSGIIEELGAGVDGWSMGDRVTVYPVDYCGVCSACREEKYNLCPNKRQFGVLSVDGAFAEYICVPAKCCIKLNDSVSFSVGSTIEPLSVAYRAVERAGDIGGRHVCIIGAGTIGLMILACARMKKPSKIIVSDINKTRLAIALKMGADIVVNPAEQDFGDALRAGTNGGADISFEAVGTSVTCRQSITALKNNGMSVWVGMNRPVVDINMLELVTKELNVRGTFLYGLREFETAARLINGGALDISPVISLEAPMESGGEMFDRVMSDQRLVKVILTD